MIAWHSVVPPFLYGYSISLSASSYSCFAFCFHRRHDVVLTLQVIIGKQYIFYNLCVYPSLHRQCTLDLAGTTVLRLLFIAILSCRTLFSNEDT
jgi:hypothetical protein